MFGRWTFVFRLLGKSKLSMFGAGLVTTGFLIEAILVFAGDLLLPPNPYIAIFTLQLVPGLIGSGLLLIAVGLGWAVRRAREGRTIWATLQDFGKARYTGAWKRAGFFVCLLTMINLTFFALIGYKGLHYVDSVEFCGLVCHHVMEPEYTAYQRSPHAGVPCVDCHIGPGPEWFVKAKVNGARQVWQVATDSYAQPIPVPVHALRAADDICGHCHQSRQFRGNRMKVVQRYTSDEFNTERHTVVNLRLGGVGGLGFEPQGVHWHASKDVRLVFESSDSERRHVQRVRVEQDGVVRTWERADAPEVEHAVADGGGHGGGHAGPFTRQMDCTDCHNRIGHHYLDSEEALDERIVVGEIDARIPWIRKESLALLEAPYSSKDEASEAFARLPEIYRSNHPAAWERHQESIKETVEVLERTWATFVWPNMNITWGTYPSHIGHGSEEGNEFGCYRCHNDSLVSPQGETISNQCELCHYVLAVDEPDPEVFRCLTVVRSTSLFDDDSE